MSLPTTPSLPGEPSPLSDRPAALVQVFGLGPFHTDGELFAVGFAADGTLWSVEDRGVLKHWDPATSRPLGDFDLDDLATLWAFSPGCRYAASGSDELSLWDVNEAELVAAFAPPSWVTALAFSADGKTLASGHDDGSVRLWDVAARRLTGEVRGHNRPISAIAFSPDGTELASAGEDKSIRVVDLASKNERLRLAGHTDRIPALAWHPTRRRLYSAGWDTTARVWDLDTGQPVILLNSHTGQVLTLALNPTGTLLACADATPAIRLWDVETHREYGLWADQAAEVRCLAFGPDGYALGWGGADSLLHVRDARQPADDEPPDPLQARTGVAAGPEGRLYHLPPGRPLRGWDTASGRCVVELNEAGGLRAFALSPDGRWVAGSLATEVPAFRLRLGGTGIPSLFLWDAASGDKLRLLDGQAPPVTALTYSPDGKSLATASYQQADVWLWDVDSGEPKLLIPNAVDGCGIECLAFHPRGEILAVGGIDWMATGGSDGAVALWDVASQHSLVQFGQGTRALAMHPSGTKLAAVGLGRKLQVWSVPAGELLATIEGHTDTVNAAAYSPDGKLLATAGDDQTVRLWDADTGAPRALVLLDTPARALCFSPDGAALYSANANRTAYQFDVARLQSDGV